ncbi:hypothetical protein Tco_1525477 [Tanacetum coccineum]
MKPLESHKFTTVNTVAFMSIIYGFLAWICAWLGVFNLVLRYGLVGSDLCALDTDDNNSAGWVVFDVVTVERSWDESMHYEAMQIVSYGSYLEVAAEINDMVTMFNS